MKLVFDTFKAIKFEELELKELELEQELKFDLKLENAVFSFASNSSSFFSEIETAVSSAKCVLRHGNVKALTKSFI